MSSLRDPRGAARVDFASGGTSHYPRAIEDARLWLCQPGSGTDGLRRWEALDAARHALRDHPYTGRINADRPRLRQLVVVGYRLIYRISPDTGEAATAGDIRILQVFGPGQV